MARQKRYTGFFNPNEKFGGNNGFYSRCLADHALASSLGISEEFARRQLYLYEKFPEPTHSRLVGHEVEVYAVKEPGWFKRGKAVIPQGSLENVLKLDLGQEIRKICEKELTPSESVLEEDVVHELGDGTVIRGNRIRTNPYPGKAGRREIPNPYLVLTYDSSLFRKLGAFCYGLDLKRNNITPLTPVECHVKKYVLINQEKIHEEREVARAAFSVRSDGKTPVKFLHFIFSKK